MAVWGAVDLLLLAMPECTGSDVTWSCVNVTYSTQP
jgi:hypothetical protein